MLVFVWADAHPPPSHPPHPVLALALPAILVALLAAQTALSSVKRVKARQGGHENGNGHAEEVESLLHGDRKQSQPTEHDARAEGSRTVLELLKVLGASGLLGVTLVKLVGRPGGAWETVMDVGVVVVAVSWPSAVICVES